MSSAPEQAENPRIYYQCLSPQGMGAIALIQLWEVWDMRLLEQGADPEEGHVLKAFLKKLTGRENWPDYRVQLTKFEDIDEGLTVFLPPDSAQLMPHGGTYGVSRCLKHLQALGAVPVTENSIFRPDSRQLYPEAENDIEADMLEALAKAASPSAVDLLLKQPRIWRTWWQGTKDVFHHPNPPEAKKRALHHELKIIKLRSKALNHFISPPLIVLAGEPNSGKSTLTNYLAGREAAIVSATPGTTRDYVSLLVELHHGGFRLHANWYDTPGIRETKDHIEAQAIQIARQVIPQANLVLAIKTPDQASQFPALPACDATILQAISQSDRAERPMNTSERRHFSVHQEAGLTELQSAIFQGLGITSDTLTSELPWAFSEALNDWIDSLMGSFQ